MSGHLLLTQTSVAALADLGGVATIANGWYAVFMSRCLIAAAALAGCSACAGLHGCFAAPTMIATPTGPRRIDDLAVGEEVWSFDPLTSRLAIVAVHAIHRTRGRIHTVRTSRGAIAAVTATHPLYVTTRSAFAPVASLTSDDRLLYWNGDQPVAADIIEVVAPIGDDTVEVVAALFRVHRRTDISLDCVGLGRRFDDAPIGALCINAPAARDRQQGNHERSAERHLLPSSPMPPTNARAALNAAPWPRRSSEPRGNPDTLPDVD